ncbi:MAG: hypothetical protein A2033_11830 [Bacteroidetes bacterium GWA2_31_9]|nr:MAG: hypothetical protein A2033_11830 [Bacteroidetes bacterium GWA2_31_9]
MTNKSWSQRLSEDFSGNYIYGWKFINNSSPQPYQANTWKFKDFVGSVGPANGYDFFSISSEKYAYAYVGYSKYDYDGANISNWFITPIIYDVKSGDELRFITTAQPDISTFDNLLAFANMDVNKLADCNRPNKLEVRLSLDISDSVNVGNTADSYGTFTTQLKEINSGLTLPGYPQTWTEYVVKIEGVGIPKNELFNCRIGFWYHIPNGGFNNCQTRFELPTVADNLLTLAENYPIISNYAQYVRPAMNLIELAVGGQVGKNGTNIGLDDIKVLSTPGVFVEYWDWNTRKSIVWHANNLNNPTTIKMGYQGSPSCSSPDYPYPATKNFSISNNSDQTVTVVPKIASLNGNLNFGLQLNIDTITLAKETSSSFTVSLQENIPYNLLSKLWFEDLSGNKLGEIRFSIYIDPVPSPIARCITDGVGVLIPNSGASVPASGVILDNGSTSCNSTSNLTYKMLIQNGYEWDSLTNISCDQLGTNAVQLIVTDTITGRYSTCDATLNVNIGLVPIIESGYVQEYFVNYTGSMPLSAITPPAIVSGCGNVTPSVSSIYNSNNYTMGTPDQIAPGTYTVNWYAQDKAGHSGYGTSTLIVIDNIKPIARCKTIADIGYTEFKYGYTWVKTKINGSDIDDGSFDNHGVKEYLVKSSWNGNGTWKNEISYECSDAGSEFDVWLKAVDHSGNADSCLCHVKLAQPDQPLCRDISIDLDPQTGITFINANSLLLNGGNNVCGITNASVSKNSFNCSDVNQTIPVTVTYQDATNNQHTCISNVHVKQFSEAGSCQDTVVAWVPEYWIQSGVELGPVINSVCSSQLPWSFTATGSNNLNEANISGSLTDKYFSPGITNVNRWTTYLDSTYTCNQTFLVIDNINPLIKYYDPIIGDSLHWEDISVQLAGLGNSCTYPHVIRMPFIQGSIASWSYTLSGATIGSTTYRHDYYYDAFWEDKTVDLKPGITTITLTGKDLAGNTTTFSYNFDLYIQEQIQPVAYSAELQTNNIIQADLCGETYYYEIESPLGVACDQTDYMWFYEVRDSYFGNILYEQDSIPQDSGAAIPIKIGPKYNQTYSRTIHLGYHTKPWGTKEYQSYPTVSVQDTVVNMTTCSNDTTINNTNNSTFNYNYTLKPPAGICLGAFWGFSVSGATNFSTQNIGANYNSNQVLTLNNVNISDAYPSLPTDSMPVLQLNNGINIIKLRMLEESGNYDSYGGCTFIVNVIDSSTPSMTCPADVTLHRTATDSCSIAIGDSCQQINGFIGPYSESRIVQIHNNNSITFDRTTTPGSITFYTYDSDLSGNDEVIGIRISCGGTVSFDWEYKTAFPSYFRPFILVNEYNPYAYSQPAMSGFSNSNTGLQSGTFSQTVNAGDIILIGLTEGGFYNGYFKISNFSAPYSDITTQIAQPSYNESPVTYFESDVMPSYGIGDHTINYKLTNTNNGNTVSCTQQLTVIDDFASALACVDATIYLNIDGYAVLKPENIVSSCFPVSSTTISKDTFYVADIGTQTTGISSINQVGDTLTCTVNVNVMDTIKPKLYSSLLTINLDYNNNASLSNSAILSLFYDNDTVVSVSASQTNYNCYDIGTKNITISATDASGNIGSFNIIAQIYPLGFAINDPDTSITICVGEYKNLNSHSGNINNPMMYQWQLKEKNNNLLPWNYYTCFNSIDIVKDGQSHQFRRQHINQYWDDTYMAYLSGYNILFKKHNRTTENWDPEFTSINRDFTVSNAYYFDFSTINRTLYVMYLDSSIGVLKGKYYQNGVWYPSNYSFFYSTNFDHTSMFSGDSYVFPVKWNGIVRTVKVDGYGTWASQIDALHTPASYVSNTYVTNGGNIVGIRNSNNQNMFFAINLHTAGHIIGKDSLTTDPTDNSSVFTMYSFNDTAYIAYKSLNGKACVKKYMGSDTWTNVGALDFTSGNIARLDIASVEDTLYVVYVETTDSMHISKYINGTWVEMPSPSDNLSHFYFSTANAEIQDIDGKVAIYNGKLIRQEGWHNVSTNSGYTINSSEPSDNQYRNIVYKSNCSYNVSGTYNVNVKEVPSITVTDGQVLNEGTAVLTAEYSAGTAVWMNDLEGNFLLGTGQSLTTPYLYSDTTFFVYVENAPCYSDTVKVNVFVNDMEIPDFSLNYRDSVCPNEWVAISIDTPSIGYRYELYEKQGADYILIDGPTWQSTLYAHALQTNDYKVKLIEDQYDAAHFSIYLSQNLTEHLNFGNVSLPITNQLTIEAWVSIQVSSYPEELLSHVYSNGGSIYDTGNTRNWEWTDGKFYVHNGSQTRQLIFPTLPTNSGSWVHVATTAGPDGLAIYYNGILVASSTTASTTNINTNNAALTYGLKINGIKGDYVFGLDDFRIWNTKRTQTQISNNMNACLTGNETGLILYNNFNTLQQSTNTFPSIKGNNAVLTNLFGEYYSPVLYRNGACKYVSDYISTKFLAPITIHVINGQPTIATALDYYSTANSCGGENVQLIATSTSGEISWYDDEFAGNLLGIGDTISVFIDQDMYVYAQPSTICQRKEAWIDINAYPEITDLGVSNPICPGDYLYDANIYYDYTYDTDDVNFYDAPIGGNLIDAWDEITEINETDTIYAEAYNAFCVANNRIPLVIPVIDVKITSANDTTICDEGSATINATGVGGLIEWWTFDWNNVNIGSEFTTPNLTQTTSYMVRANGTCSSRFDTVTVTVIKLDRFDTVLVCGSYIWENGDGNLYSQSDSSIMFYKPNTLGCDSVFHLFLTVVPNNLDILVSKPDICAGDSTTITIKSSLAAFNYTIKDTSNSSTVFGPINGNGGDLIFNTGQLADSKGYGVMMDATTIVAGDTLYCSEQNIVNITVGYVSYQQDAFVCNSYFWHGNTYTETGMYYDTLTSVNGCDSIVTLNLTILGSSYITETVNSCESYTWHDSTYTASTDSATWYGINPLGCDSIVTLHLTIDYPTTSTEVQEVCGSFTWIDGITYTNSTNTPTYNFSSSGGCDSIVTLNLTIKSIPPAGYDTIVTCDSYTWIDGITYTSSNNTALYNIPTANGCDSTVFLHLTISHNTSTSNAIVCDNYTWTDGNTYTTSGVYSQVLTSVNGCDSTLILNLTINNSLLYEDSHSICIGGVYNWHGTDYSVAGIYYDSLVSTFGCDSIYKLTLNVNQLPIVSFTGLSAEYCKVSNAVLLVGNQSISGIFSGNGISGNNIFNPINANIGVNTISYSYTDINGCSSVYTQDVIVNDVPSVDVVVTNSDCNQATGTAQINVTGGTSPYTYSTGSSSASNLSAGIYSAVVTDSKGCVQTKKFVIADNNAPTLTVVSTNYATCSNSCDGSASLSITGGVTPYNIIWSSGENMLTASELCAGEQTVQITDATGCINGGIIPIDYTSPSPSLYGRITYSLGGLDGQYAKLNVYSRTQHANGGFDLLSSNYMIASDGTFYLENFEPDTYVLRVEMLPSNPNNRIINSYYNETGTATTWETADSIVLNCGQNYEANITMFEIPSITPGPGQITGALFYPTAAKATNPKGIYVADDKAAGDPVQGAEIYLNLEPDETPTAITSSDINGIYNFTGIPYGTYSLWVEIPGYPMFGTYNITIDALNSTFTGLNFYVDTTADDGNIDTVMVYVPNISSQLSVSVYPNLSSDKFNVYYNLQKSSKVSIDLYDVLGNKISTIANTEQLSGKYHYEIDSNNEGMRPGTYFVRIIADDKVFIKKLILTE